MSMREDDEFSHQSQLALEISRHEIRKLRARAEAAEAEVADHMAGESRLLELANFWQEKANNLQAEVARLKPYEDHARRIDALLNRRGE